MTRDCIRKTLFSSQLKPNKLDFYIMLRQKGLSVKNPLAYNAHSQVAEKMKYCDYSTRDCIHKTLFSSQLKNDPNKLEFYITLGQKGLSVKNSLDYNVHSQVT